MNANCCRQANVLNNFKFANLILICKKKEKKKSIFQVSEAGIHRPHVAGIHGREDVGAFSIVLSGGYEDDVVRQQSSSFFMTFSN